MVEIDNSIKDEYYSQINNRFKPIEACMPTSFVMALLYNKIPLVPSGTPCSVPSFVYPRTLQPEDYLMAICNSPWGTALRDNISWAKSQSIPPNQVHAVISEIINDIVGRNITKFEANKNMDDLIYQIRKGKSLVVSGRWVSTGHAVVVVGLRENEAKQVTHILIDDPYGNYHTNYQDKNGNNVWFTVEQFNTLWAKWYHIFDRNGV